MRYLVTVAVLAAAIAGPLRAQSGGEPSLIFTITGGLTTGQKLWNIDNQELPVVNTPGETDSVRLGRRLVPGLAASLGMSLFRNRHWGLNGEVAYFGITSDQTCIGTAVYKPDGSPLGSSPQNQVACNTANGHHVATSVIGFLAGGVYQFFDSSAVRPYIRANAGVGLLAASFVETNGFTNCGSQNVCPFPLLLERSTRSMTWIVSLAGGFSMDLGPGYRVRMEGRDLILTIPRVNGPATPGAGGNVADSKSVLKHIPIFTIGFDIMLERRRSRRY